MIDDSDDNDDKDDYWSLELELELREYIDTTFSEAFGKWGQSSPNKNHISNYGIDYKAGGGRNT